MNDRRSSNASPTVEGTNQLIELAEIKQEPGIKEEPDPVADLIEFPALNNCDAGQSFGDSNQFGIKGDYVEQTGGRVKIEVKQEISGKIKKVTKPNGANDRPKPRNTKPNRNGQDTTREANETANKKIKRLKQHQCQCEYSTNKKSNLKIHLLKHTGEKPFPCDRCAKTFAREVQLKYHMKVHVNEFLFHCLVCLKGFNRKNKKIEHQSNCKTLRYECHLCKESFGSFEQKLTTHMCVHSGEKSFACTECLKRFAWKGDLKSHMELHAGPRPFRCSKCRREFALQNKMIAHEQKCSRRVYECHICGKFIGLGKPNLEQHMCTHTGDKPFECAQCPKKYTHKSHLCTHMKIHSRSLPWKCVICRQGFAIQIQWKSHQHNCTQRRYECHLCKKFIGPYNANLKTHMTKHSGEKRFQCEICGGRFTQKGHLTRHINAIHNKMYGRINRI